MSKKKHLVPFRLLPGSIGLSGKSYEEAEANYYYDGYELDIRLAEINYEGNELEIKKLNIDHKHNKISKYDLEIKTAELTLTGQALEEKKLDIDLEFEKIKNQEYDKKKATIRKEPWVAVVESTFDKSLRSNGFKLSLDWNDYFIDMLESEGYNAPTPEEIVEMWFDDINRNAQEELVDDAWESGDFESLPNKLTKKIKNDGKSTYS